jgi:predicted kinase
MEPHSDDANAGHESGHRRLIVVNGIPGSGKSTLAGLLSRELRLHFISKDSLKDFLAQSAPSEPDAVALSAEANDVMWAVVSALPHGAIVETWFGPTGAARVRQGLVVAGVPEHRVVEIWCDVPVEVARERFAERLHDGARHARHNLAAVDPSWWANLEARPLGIGAQLHFATEQPPSDSAVRGLADNVRALLP